MTALGSRGTGQAGRPTWWASSGSPQRRAAAAVRSIGGATGREFLAELYGMTPAEQRHHAIGILSRIWTLWMALTEPERLTQRPL